jgi:hypothetical protein
MNDRVLYSSATQWLQMMESSLRDANVAVDWGLCGWTHAACAPQRVQLMDS